MDLSNYIVESKTIKTEYPAYDDLVVSLAHLTRDELMDIRKKATSNKLNKKSKVYEEVTDSELFQDLYIKAVVVGWSGFKFKYLEDMVPMDTSKMPAEEYKEGEGLIAYSKENATFIMKNCSDFDNWVTSELDDIENFTKNS